MLGMIQEKLGDAIGLTFQQVQEYEKGTNRMGSIRLQQVANVLPGPNNAHRPPNVAAQPEAIDACLPIFNSDRNIPARRPGQT